MSSSSLARVAAVARALGPLRERVVFIGGALAPLLQTEPPFAGPRPTDDVDAIAVTTSYSDFDRLRGQLRGRGFVESAGGRHAHRWVLRDQGIDFDLVPAGSHPGASGNPWDTKALESAVETEIEPGLSIRHVDATGFLVLKLGAYSDRGSADPFSSHDLEDILALVASRPGIAREVEGSRASTRTFIARWFRTIRESAEYDDLLHAHLGNIARQHRDEVLSTVRRRVERMARGQQSGRGEAPA